MHIRFGVIAAGILAATAAAAQTAGDEVAERPWYVEFGVGYHFPVPTGSHSALPAPDGQPYDWTWTTESGGAMAGSIGYRFTPHLRAEIESGYYNSSLISVHAPGGAVDGLSASRPDEPYGLCGVHSALPNCEHPGGWTFMWTGMVNGIYDILPDWRVDPFVGVGAGLAHVEWAAHSRTDLFSGVPGPITASNPVVQEFKNAGTLNRPSQIAVQVLAGVSYRVLSCLRLDLTYYHYLTAGELRWNPENTTPGLPAGAGLRTGDFMGRFQDDSVIASVRYAF